jgi:hypothetical protein
MTKVYDFVSTFDLKNCMTRLDRRSEKTSLLASKYATRLKVDVWGINRITAGFKIYKTPRSSLAIGVGWFSLQVRGKLQARPDGGTQVVYQVWQHPIGRVMEWGLTALVGVIGVLAFYQQLYDSLFHPIAILVFIGATGLGIGGAYIYRQYIQIELITVIRNSLGDLETELDDYPKEKRKQKP